MAVHKQSPKLNNAVEKSLEKASRQSQGEGDVASYPGCVGGLGTTLKVRQWKVPMLEYSAGWESTKEIAVKG